LKRYIIPEIGISPCLEQFLETPPMSDPQSLKNMGLKATFPRLKILELFEKSTQRHMTAEDVYRMLISENMDIGLATVYRVLTQFEQAGLLERHFFESGKAVFEINRGKHHDHLVCIDCGRVEEFYDPEIEKRQNALPKNAASPFRITRSISMPSCTKGACARTATIRTASPASLIRLSIRLFETVPIAPGPGCPQPVPPCC
jgi:Fur family ferric uptake transcriptional regulator